MRVLVCTAQPETRRLFQVALTDLGISAAYNPGIAAAETEVRDREVTCLIVDAHDRDVGLMPPRTDPSSPMVVALDRPPEGMELAKSVDLYVPRPTSIKDCWNLIQAIRPALGTGVRRLVRIPATIGVKVQLSGQEQVTTTVNVGLGGLAVAGNLEQFGKNELAYVHLGVPFAAMPVQAECSVAWCEAEVSGLRFRSMPLESVHELCRYISLELSHAAADGDAAKESSGVANLWNNV